MVLAGKGDVEVAGRVEGDGERDVELGSGDGRRLMGKGRVELRLKQRVFGRENEMRMVVAMDGDGGRGERHWRWSGR